MDSGIEQKVRERAYDMWVAAGMEDGLADAHWLRAERAVMGESSAPVIKMAKAAKPRPATAAPTRKTTKAKVAA